MMMSTTKPNKRVLKARRGSFVVRPPRPPTNQVLQPKRRASFATFRPKTSSYMTASLNSSNSRLRTGHVMGRQSFAWDPQRVWHASRVQSPMPRLREGVAATVMATPIAPRNSKFVGSPPTQAGSWRPKHPTVVALQKKHLVWSPLKLRVVKNGNRKSFLPSDAQIKL